MLYEEQYAEVEKTLSAVLNTVATIVGEHQHACPILYGEMVRLADVLSDAITRVESLRRKACIRAGQERVKSSIARVLNS